MSHLSHKEATDRLKKIELEHPVIINNAKARREIEARNDAKFEDYTLESELDRMMGKWGAL